MKVKLPQYSGKDYRVMLVMVPLFSFLLNCINLGGQYFSSFPYFLLSSLVTMAAFSFDFILCGGIAVALKKRLPSEEELMQRLSLMIITFLLITGLFLYSLFNLFEHIPFFQYQFNQRAFLWGYFSMGIINVFLTFLMEGIARYQKWKANWEETEKLNEAYKQSQLNGLKSQVNPHFLFNSLNSLSSLIQDDEEKAEKFLDEMSKVYRYMLRNDEEQFVTMETELKFIESYMHLLKARYGDGLQLEVNISAEDKNKLVPPLTLQVIIENTFSQNTISKSHPLIISINSDDNGNIKVANNVQPKIISDAMDFEAGLDNLIKKYDLLSQPVNVSDASKDRRVITLPLLTKKEKAIL